MLCCLFPHKPTHPHHHQTNTQQVARLKEIHASADPKKGLGSGPKQPAPDKVELVIDWYYRPEDVPGGRKVFHGRRELLQSDHADRVPASTVDGWVTVHTLDAYRALPTVEPSDYFWRFRYLASRSAAGKDPKFWPERVPVFCVCRLPYSPDLAMVQCAACEDWFHPACVGMDEPAARALEAAAAAGKPAGEEPTFACPSCREKGRGSAAMAGVRKGGSGRGDGGGGGVPAASDVSGS